MTRLAPLAAASALAWTVTAAEPAATPSPSSTPPTTQATASVAAKTEKPPPLPLHEIEGNGGIFSMATSFGTVANHEANGVWGLTAKWEF